MKSRSLGIRLVSVLAGGVLAFAVFTQAAQITFPVAELGNCRTKAACKAYCDKEENRKACITFAKKQGLMNEMQAQKAEKAVNLPPEGGPGGCKNFGQCKIYCSISDHAQECIQFAREHKLIEEEEAQEALRMAEIIRNRSLKLPGNCDSKESCKEYCSQEEHVDECLSFAKEAGMLDERQYEIAKKTRGKGPGGCKGEECKEYCRDEAHIEECISFAKEHGLISEKEAQAVRETKGNGPGGCKGQECKAYCENPDHYEECVEFARKHGFMSEEDYDRAKRTQGQGPGGCTDREECMKYCQEHQEECAAFAKERGLQRGDGMREEEGEDDQGTLQRPVRGEMPEGISADRPSLDLHNLPPRVQRCLAERFGEEEFEKIKRADGRPDPEVENAIRRCMELLRQDESQNSGEKKPFHEDRSVKRTNGEERGEEDKRACPQIITPARNPETNVCRNFPSPCLVPENWVRVAACERASQTPSERSFEQKEPLLERPEGCSTPEECKRFCEENPDRCPQRQELEDRASMDRAGRTFIQLLLLLLGGVVDKG